MAETIFYPNDLDSINSAYMIISAYPYDFKLQKNAEVFSNDNTTSKNYKFHFITYVPKDISYNNRPTYKDIHALTLTGAASMDEGSLRQTFTGLAQLGIKFSQTFIEQTAEGISEGLGFEDVVKTTKEQMSLASGLWEDPRMVNVFQSPSGVSQNFTFQLFANNLEEAKKIKKLMLLFKYSALPTRIFNSEFFEEAIPLLTSPMNYDITIVTPAGVKFSLTSDFDYMNLENVEIKPITDSNKIDVPFYEDGNVIGYEMKLDFKSMHPILRPISHDDDDIKSVLTLLNGEEIDNTEKMLDQSKRNRQQQ